jgi:hypothetical protein
MIVEKFESIIWTPRYYDKGDFELYLPASEEMMKICTDAVNNHYYFINADDLSHVMIATKIEKVRDVDDFNHISLTGFDAKWILRKRIVWGTAYLSGNLETELRRLITENAIDTVIPERKIPNLELGDRSGEISDIISSKVTGNNLDDVISSVCKIYHVGWDVLLDYPNKKFKVIFYKGKDRSASQTDNRRVIFSIKNDNLLSTTHKIDTSNFRNVVYVDATVKKFEETTTKFQYKDYISDQKTYTYVNESYGQIISLDYANPSGNERYEAYLDGGENDQTGDSKDNLNVFRYTLRAKGKQALDKYEVTTDVTGKIVPNMTNFLGVNYNLGDEVEVVNEYDQSFKTRVTEVVKTLSSKGYSEIPTFAIEDPNNDPDTIKEEECFATDHGTDPDFEYFITEDGEIFKMDTGWEEDYLVTEDGEELVTDSEGEITENNLQLAAVISEYEKELNDLALSTHKAKG